MDKNYAYITLLSNDDFIAGVHLLKYSLDSVNAAYPLLCMVTDNVSDSTVRMLERLGIHVIHVSTIEMPKLIDKHNKRLNEDQAARWHDTFTKYHIFRFTEYDKLIFLDADLYFLKNTDHAFELPHMTAALDGEMFDVHPGNPHFNGGFMVIQPNLELFELLIDFLNRIDPLYFDGLVADQEVLNFFYSDWPKHPELHLNKYYNIFAPYCQVGVADETVRKDAVENAVFYHFIGKKPWEHWNRDCWGVPEFQFLRPLIDQLEEDRKKLTPVKTCVYTICKNEEKNVEKWYQSVKDSDAVCVIDTGSTDSTWDKLLACGDNMYIDKYEYDGEFDFSKARNFSLEKARQVCKSIDSLATWIFITVDLDEFLLEYAISHIKDTWQPEFDTMKLHCIKDDTTGVVEHKIHSDGKWSWHRSIHEIPQLEGKKRYEWVCGDICTAYEHIQDKTKERDYYTLLKKEHEREPNNATTLVYLAWEAIEHEDWDKVLEYSEAAIELITEDEDNELYLDYQSLIQCYLNCGDYWKAKEDPENQLLALNAAVEVIENDDFYAIRKPYILRGDLKEVMGDHAGAIDDYNRALDIVNIPYCWVDDEEFYNDDQVFNRMTISYYHQDDLASALVYANKTLEVFDGFDFYHTNKELIENEIKARDTSGLQVESVTVGEPIDISELMNDTDKKICVYAICKDEAHNVSKWLDSIDEADYIVVLDTGSSDGTFELLQADPRVTVVEQKTYDTWRFDTARNDALALVPKDTTIFVSIDLDEVFEPGWAKILRDEWKPNTTKVWYNYVWSHNESGMPGREFSQCKIHSANYRWAYPVHEQLLPVDIEENFIDLTTKITVHHWPAGKVSRSSYLPLLELRADEDDGTDSQGKIYLTHEYYYNGVYDKCIELGKSLVTNDNFSSLEKANILLFIGDALQASGKLTESIGYYFEAIQIDKEYREPYCALAKIFNSKENWNQTILLLETALKVTCRRGSWLEQNTAWSGEVEDLLSLAYFFTEQYDKGYVKLLQALKLDPNNDRYRSNVNWFEDKLKIQ